MVHLYCRKYGIKDTSRGGTYHNGQFKEVAENYGLICSKDIKRGWTTSPSEELIDLIANHEWGEIRIIRGESNNSKVPKQRSTCTMYVYGCPKCGPRLQASRNVNFICTCGEKLVRLQPANGKNEVS